MMKATNFSQVESPMLLFLQEQGIDFSAKGHSHYVLRHCMIHSEHSPHTCEHGLMDLVAETWWEKVVRPYDKMIISVCHYGLQNGDLMKDPEMVFKWTGEFGIEIPTEFYNDYTGTVQETFPMQDGKEMINPQLIKELQAFTKTWVKNLRFQGQSILTDADKDVEDRCHCDCECDKEEPVSGDPKQCDDCDHGIHWDILKKEYVNYEESQKA